MRRLSLVMLCALIALIFSVGLSGLWCVLSLYHICARRIYKFIQVTRAQPGHHDVSSKKPLRRLQMDSVMGVRREVLLW
jgi:hypothetical protein